jgi:ABC-type sugar transport system ATPase subunit
MIRLDAVSKRYGSASPAVSELTLDVAAGEVCVLVGPSGCGKTTTLKMINRLIEPTSGRIYLDGEEVTHADPVHLRRRIGYVIQQVGLFPHLTIGANAIASRRASTSCCISSDSIPPTTATGTRRSCRVVSANGSEWRARSPRIRPSCSWTNRSGLSIR